MVQTPISEGTLKEVLKDALREVLEERRDLFRDLVEDVLMDMDGPEDAVHKGGEGGGSWMFGVTEGEA